MKTDEILHSLNWRYAVKQFDPLRKIPQNLWDVLEASLILSPSSYGLQPWKFLVVETPTLRQELKQVSWNQSQVTEASHFVVFLTRDKVTEEQVKEYIEDMAKTRGVSREDLKGFEDMLNTNIVRGMTGPDLLNWTQRQAYIAMGFLLETAALLEVDTVPMEGLDPAAYDKILKIEGSGWRTVAAVALGYRHPEDKLQYAKKVRFSAKKIIQKV
jgi:nitroreductase